jgi:hypothetical protein
MTDKAPVLTRTLECTSQGAVVSRDITVSIGAPEPDPMPGGDFRVLVEISGFDKPYAQYFHGVDAIQAMMMGTWIVPDLVRSLAGRGARVTWLGSENLGFRYGEHLTDEGDSDMTPCAVR